MTRIKLGVSLVCDRIREFPGWVRAVEQAGFDAIGVGDSPSLYPEVYSQATVVALNTNRVMFGPRVTNPITRHPTVTASAIATVDELSGGRAVLGIGTGDSAAYNAGERSVTLDFMRDYIRTLRDLFSDGAATYHGKKMVFRKHRRMIPVYMAAHGPKSLQMAGELCEGVIIGGGVGRQLVPDALAHVEAGAKKAGRRMADIDIWWLIGASIEPTLGAAIEGIKTHLAAAANATFRLGVKNKGVPGDMEAAIEKLIAGYDFTKHEHVDVGNRNVSNIEALGLTSYLADRFTVAGSPEQFAARVKEIASWGAPQLWFTMPRPDKHAFIDAMRERVIPTLNPDR
jgi:5,10-methylenetetrahydromethanopterin reductase